MAELDPADKNSICTSHSTLYSLQPTTGAGSLPDCESDKLCARIAVLEESNLRTVELLRALSETCMVERARAKTGEKEHDGLLARVAALETSVAHERANLKAERAGFQMEQALLQSERAELDMNRFVYLYKPTNWQVFLTIPNNGSRAKAIESNHALLLVRGAALGASAANKGVTLDNGRERKALQVDSEHINVDMMGESLRMQLAPSEKAMGAAPASTPSCPAANHLTARLRSRLRDYGGRVQAPEQREDLPVATLGSLATYAHRATDDDDREPTINLDMTHDPPLERALAALPNADLSSPSLAAAAALSVCPPATNHATAPPAFCRNFQEKEEEDRECAPPRKRQKASSRNDLLPPPPETIPSPPALPDGYSLSDLSEPQTLPRAWFFAAANLARLCPRPRRTTSHLRANPQPRPTAFGVCLPAALLHDRQHEFALPPLGLALRCLFCRCLSFDCRCPVCTPSAPEASNRSVNPLSALLVLAQEGTPVWYVPGNGTKAEHVP
ncbi:hypothetical protein B0H17DRAFT_1230139 [Mycena rosella]|uniref:Uncharacterized protein n=1 Tax=Mycena rosella TaxID=1033263 RepID=A0AAD7D7A2_MYCRO|nr:hypothetical protein B0H17DRAFT_1230139 [Mycena rosella]